MLIFIYIITYKIHYFTDYFLYKAKLHIKVEKWALVCVAQWIEYRPVGQGVAGSIPGLGHMPGLWARSLVRDA